MAKKGVYKITGNTHPKTDKKTVYQVTEWYPDTPNSERRDALVIWELFKKNDKGQFVTTHIKKKGIGEFTFGKQSYESTFMVEGYLHSPERKEPMAIIVNPQKNDGPTSKERDIIGVKLTYQDGSNITKALSYMDRLRATVKCQNLDGQHLTLSLWEDDEKHEGHNQKNQFITKSPPIEVDSRGYARWSFTLLRTYISLANKREDDKKQHEYYILAEYNGKLQASDNVNVNNPEYKVPPPTSRPAPAKKPQPKPDTPKGSTHQGSSNNQPDKKGIIKKITLVDKDGKPFKRRPTFGQTIKLIIEAQDVVGKKYNLKLWEHDSWGGDDLLYNNTHTFKSDRQEVLIPLTHEMQTIGEIGIDPKNPNYGEYWTGNWQEIYAEVTLLYISTKSPIINVDIEKKPKVLDNGRSAWKMEKSEVMKEEKEKCFCNRDFTPEEFEKIIHSLRDSETQVKKNSGYTLFGANNCKLRAEDKTMTKLREQINIIFNHYDVNSCIRKIHFIAQIYHETDRLRTTLEYETNKSYKPYFGRGLMQLTWEINYKIYGSYSGTNCFNDYEIIEKNLIYACDSAGWFWKQGKVLSVSERWKGPSDAPTYVKVHKPDYPKTTITWKDGNKKLKYGTVNLGLIADDDKIDLISYLVNGGSNGLQERRNYAITLKNIFKYPQECITRSSKKTPQPINSSDTVIIRLERKWQTNKSTIGEFSIDNTSIKGYIIEEKGPDTTISGIEQRVPIGTYNLEWHSGTKIKKGLKLFNDVVAKSRAILIHAGNSADDTEGCLLPGSTKSMDYVGGSRAKLKEIFDYIEEIGITNAKIIITQNYE